MEASFATHSVAVRGGLLESIAFTIFLLLVVLLIRALGIIVTIVWAVAHVSTEVLANAVSGLDLLVVGGADGAIVDGVRL